MLFTLSLDLGLGLVVEGTDVVHAITQLAKNVRSTALAHRPPTHSFTFEDECDAGAYISNELSLNLPTYFLMVICIVWGSQVGRGCVVRTCRSAAVSVCVPKTFDLEIE